MAGGGTRLVPLTRLCTQYVIRLCLGHVPRPQPYRRYEKFTLVDDELWPVQVICPLLPLYGFKVDEQGQMFECSFAMQKRERSRNAVKVRDIFLFFFPLGCILREVDSSPSSSALFLAIR